MARFADLTVSAFLDALASPEPTPGGGTAAAIAGTMGASLLMMVAGLSKSRGGAEQERVALAEARAALASVRDRLATLADRDTEAFNQVMAAYRLAKGTDEERTARKEAIQIALKAATTTPLDTLRAAADGVRLAKIVAQYGNPTAASDVGVGITLLESAAAGAAANVRINLGGLHDEAFKASAAADVDTLTATVTADASEGRVSLDA